MQIIHQKNRQTIILRQRHTNQRRLEPRRQNRMVHIHRQQQPLRRPKIERRREHRLQRSLLNSRHSNSTTNRRPIRRRSRRLMQRAAVIKIQKLERFKGCCDGDGRDAAAGDRGYGAGFVGGCDGAVWVRGG